MSNFSRSFLLMLAGAGISHAALAQHPAANPLNWRTVHPERILDFEPARVADALSAPNDSTMIVSSGMHGGRLYRTTDRGLTWQTSAAPAPVGRKAFFSATNGVVSYDSVATLPARVRGQLRFTTDGGDSWSAPRAVPSGYTQFLSATEALVFQQRLPSGLVVYRTADAGVTWSVIDSVSGLPRLSNFISAPSANTAYMLVGDTITRQVIQFALGRHTWRARALPPAQANSYSSELREIVFTSDSTGLARDCSGFAQRIFATTSGGRTWTAISPPPMTGGVNNSFALLDAQHILGHDDFPTQQSDLMRLTPAGTWRDVPMADYTPAPAGPGDPFMTGGLQSTFAYADHTKMLLRPSGVGWATGGGGRLYYSTDFGATWALRSRVLQATDPIAIGFPDPDHGYVAAEDDAVLRTLDQGQTWERLTNTPPLEHFMAAAFPDADSLFLTTWDGPAKVYRSTDGGQSWNLTTMPIAYPRHLAFFKGASRGLLVGSSGAVARTIDGGQTWQAGTSGTTNTLDYAAWADAQTAYATSSSNVFKSTDAGATWQPLATRPTATSYGAIAFPTPTLGFLNAGNRLYRTTDGGLTWTQLPGTHYSSPIRFSTPANGWTASHVTADSGRTWTALATRVGGYPAPIDADNAYVVGATGPGMSTTARVQRYSRHFLRTAPLATTTLATGSTYSVAFMLEGPFLPTERDFRVELSNALGRFRPGQTTTIGQGPASPIAVTLPASLPLGTRYRLRVVRADGSVLGADNGQDLTLQRPTGTTPEAEVLAAPRLFPNPAQHAVTLAFADGAQAGRTVRLLDLAGRPVLTAPAADAQLQLPLTTVPAGCYLVQTRTRDGRAQVQRLIVQP